MSLPPVGAGSTPILPPSNMDPQREPALVLSDDINKSLDQLSKDLGTVSPGKLKLEFDDIGQKVDQLQQLENEYPSQFTPEERMSAVALKDSMQRIAGQMDEITPGDVRVLQDLAERLLS